MRRAASSRVCGARRRERASCLLGEHCTGGVFAHRLGHPARQGADGGVGQKDLFSRHGKFVPAQFFVGQDFGDRHFMSMTLFSS